MTKTMFPLSRRLARAFPRFKQYLVRIGDSLAVKKCSRCLGICLKEGGGFIGDGFSQD